MSESQERMIAVVDPAHVDRFLAVFARDVRAAVIGEMRRLMMTWHGERVVGIPPGSAADGPVYDRPLARPAAQDALARPAAQDALARPAGGAGQRADLLALLGRPGSPARAGSPTSTTGTSAATLCWSCRTTAACSGWTRRPGSASRWPPTATATTADSIPIWAPSSRWRKLPERGRHRHPLAVTNCLNFGSPEDSAMMWQFAAVVGGLADGCAALGVPVTGGNVSFYNQFGTVAIPHPGHRRATHPKRSNRPFACVFPY
jgi:phosphoribosylformylglycinamidine synthase subunit PurL